MTGEKIAIFDFDGTIVSKNTGSEFYKWQARKSFLRVILLILLLPVLIPLRSIAFFTNDRYTQKWGLNIVCFISTAFQRVPLFQLRSDFISYYFSSGGAVLFQDAIERIQLHQKQGDHILVVSGCPHWLLTGIIRKAGIKNVSLVGTKVSLSWKGIIITDHCHQINKVTMCLNKGHDLTKTVYGYSDSTSDIAILKYCKEVVLVNANILQLLIVRFFIKAKVSTEQWR